MQQMQQPFIQIEESRIPYIKRIKKEKQKALIFDSGTLINLSMNGLLYILEDLKQLANVDFFITHSVKNELINRPINIPRFELGALRIQELLDDKILQLPESINIQNEQIESLTQEILNKANHLVSIRKKWINIVSNAEISCLALSKLLTERKIQNMIAIDERTTRLLSEKPENLEIIMSGRLHTRIEMQKEGFDYFKDFKFIRSTELVYVAHKKGVLKIDNPRALEAVLYATKFKGASVSYEEIDVLKKL